MRYYVVLLTLALATWACAEELYSDKYDYIDVHEILANDKLREQYYNCFMSSAPCMTPDAKFFKSKFEFFAPLRPLAPRLETQGALFESHSISRNYLR